MKNKRLKTMLLAEGAACALLALALRLIAGETVSVSPKAVSGIDRPLPHFYEGGAYPWHRKLLVM